MAIKSVGMASSSFTGEAFESIYVVVSDSDSWQVIDPSDSDDDNFSYSDDVVTSDVDDVTVVEDDNDDVVADVDDLLQHPYGSPASDISMQSLVDVITLHCQELENVNEIDHNRPIINYDDILKDDEITHQFQDIDHSRLIINGGDEDDDTDVNDDDELDDELVPKWLNNKFERQRMRKLGKRASSKMKKSKRMANQFNRPGCVHGKHGLGLKA